MAGNVSADGAYYRVHGGDLATSVTNCEGTERERKWSSIESSNTQRFSFSEANSPTFCNRVTNSILCSDQAAEENKTQDRDRR